MKSPSKWLRGTGIALAFAVTLPGVSALASQASTSTTAYTSTLTGLVVDAAGPDWTMGEPTVKPNSEYIALDQDGGYGAIAFTDSSITSDAMATTFTDSLEQSAAEKDWVFTTYPITAPAGQTTMAYSIEVSAGIKVDGVLRTSEDVVGTVDMLELINGDGTTPFDQSLTTAQAQVTIDNKPILDGVTPAEVTTALGGSTTTNGTSASTPATTGAVQSNTTDATTAPTKSAALPTTAAAPTEAAVPTEAAATTEAAPTEAATTAAAPTEAATTAAAPTEAAASPDAGTTGDLSTVGVTSDTSYTSPSFGTEITWRAGSWEIPSDPEQVPSINTEDAYDRLILWNTQIKTSWIVINTYQGSNTPEQQQTAWNTDEWIEGEYGAGSAILDTRISRDGTATVVSYDRDGETYIAVQQYVVMADGTAFNMYIYGAKADFVDAYISLQDIQIAGAPISLTYSISQIEALLA